MKKSVWLHNIRSVHNVGSIFRTADAAGIHHIYLSGYTPLPIDRFGRKRQDVRKISLGAEDSVSWSQLEHIPQDILDLKHKGAFLVMVEQDPQSENYTDIAVPEDTSELIIAMGEEVKGIEPELLQLADVIAEIPMRGAKESLNVSVAFGIVAYQTIK